MAPFWRLVATVHCLPCAAPRPHRPASAIRCVAAAVLVGLLGALGVTDLPLETATVLVPIPLDASFKLSFILEKIATTSNFK